MSDNPYSEDNLPNAKVKKVKADVQVKLITIGNSAVGKTALILRYFDEVFSHNSAPTMGVVTKFTNKKILDKNVRLQMFDTAGQEKF